MNLDIYGSGKSGWSAHGEYEPGVDPALKPCPFCLSSDLELSNTHTPSYSVECTGCGCEGPNGKPRGYTGRKIITRKNANDLHREAFNKAIELWNTRH